MELRVDRLTKQYGSKIAVDRMDFTMKAGVYGLLGANGAGKTTLTKLLLRLSDIQEGRILIDGQNIAETTQQSLRRQIAYVPQEALLFHRTIAENIAYGPANRKAVGLLDPQVAANLPTAPQNMQNAVGMNVAFWAEHGEALEQRFQNWAKR